MRILEKAEGAFGACVLYEHNGGTFQTCGSSLHEIEQRLHLELNGRSVQAADEESAPEPASVKKKDLNTEGNGNDPERKGETDI